MLETILKICCGLVLAIIVFSPVMGCDVQNFCRINESENITITVYNQTSGDIVPDAQCSISIYHNATKITDGETMNYTSDGIYSYSLSNSEINDTGIYNFNINVTKDNYHDFQSGRYEIVLDYPTAKIDAIYGNVTGTNSTLLNNIWGFYSRALSTIGENNIAQKVWDATIVGLKVIDRIPIVKEIKDYYGMTQTVQVPYTEEECDPRLDICT